MTDDAKARECGAAAMADEAKARFVAELQRRHWSEPDFAAAQAAFARIPAAFFEVAEATTDGDFPAVMRQVHDLFEGAVWQQEHRAAEAAAEFADLRRHGLHIAPDLSATPTITKECAP